MISLSLEKSIKCGKQVYCCSISKNNQVLAAGCHNGSIILANSNGEETINTCKFAVNTCKFSSKYLIAGSTDECIYIWDIVTLNLHHVVSIHKGPIRSLAISRDESVLVSGSGDQRVGITNLFTNSPPRCARYLRLNESDAGMISGVCISSSNSIVVVSSTSGNIFIYDIMICKPQNVIYDAHEMGANCCDITAFNDGFLVCSAGADYLAKLWKLNPESFEYSSCHEFSGHTGQVLCCKFYNLISEQKLALITGSVDRSVIIWDVEDKTKLHQTPCHSAFVYDVDAVGDQVLTCSSDKTMKLWNAGIWHGKNCECCPHISPFRLVRLV